MLVGVGAPGQGAGVQPGLVGERRSAHVGLLRVGRPVDHLGDPAGDRRQQLQPLGRQRPHAHLGAEVGDDRHQVAVAGALAVAVDGALHVSGPGPHPGEGVGHTAAGVVVQVHPHGGAQPVDDLGHDGVHLVRQRPAVGVAQHQPLGAGLGDRRQHGQRVVGVVLVAVEGVLGVEEHPPALPDEVRHRLRRHGDPLVEARPQRSGDVVVPALADDADRLRARRQQVRQHRVALAAPVGPPRRAEHGQPGGLKAQLVGGSGEELVVLGVGARPAALDVVHAEAVEFPGDAQLVLDGQRDAFELAAVAQRGVVDLHRRRGAVAGCRRRPCPGLQVAGERGPAEAGSGGAGRLVAASTATR